MKLRFIHFTIDDKFIDDSVTCFETSNLTDNVFYCLKKNSCSFEYIKSSIVKKIRIEEAESIIDNLSNFDVVILHSLYAIPADLICKIPSKNKVVWYAWGFDLYSNEYPTKPLLSFTDGRLKQHTRETVKDYSTIKAIKYYFDRYIRGDRYITSSASKIYEAMERVNYFAGVFQSEFDMLKEKYPNFKAKRVVHNYIHPEEFRASDIDMPLAQKGNNILLGNSAAYLCNHIDILYDLYNKTTRRDYKIYCPLSYGGRDYYIKKVIKVGKQLFGDNFIPLIAYMPFEEYSKVIQSCDNVILGYEQQAATCNCLTSMWNGLKLYVPKHSMNYIEYKNVEGLEIFSIEEDLNDDNLSNKLILDIKNQRSRISSIYSYERWKQDLNDAVTLILSEL